MFHYFFIDDQYNQQYQADNRFGYVTGVFSLLAVFIACLGLFGLSAFTIVQRTKEIGIRKAVGATKINILSQFLIEAVVLTAIGGLLGLIVGEIASLLMNRYSPLPAFVPLWAIAMGIGISAAVGIVFGLWPAWKAARLDPIEALRWE